MNESHSLVGENCIHATHVNRMQKLAEVGDADRRVVEMVKRKDKEGPQNTTSQARGRITSSSRVTRVDA